MGRLLVITVPTHPGYDVILGDCVLPGFVIEHHDNAEDADDATRRYGDHYNLTCYPLDTPWKRRGEFVLIQGGSAPSESVAEVKP